MKDPVDLVDPLIDTANRRYFFFSSACRPFGMVNLSPDTIARGTWEGGYRYNEPHVCWLSHVHAWQLAGIPVLPTTGLDGLGGGPDEHRSRFRHETETVEAGYHALTLDDYEVDVELTATDRVGFHRYRFRRADRAALLMDLGAEIGPTKISGWDVTQRGSRSLEGFVENEATMRRPKRTRIYFALDLDHDVGTLTRWATGLRIDLDLSPGALVQMKVALSYCSTEGARANLEAEVPHWDFDGVRQETRRIWNEWLGRIRVEGGTEAQQVKFYTDLYHALLGRRRVSDVGGQYCDQTGPETTLRQIPLLDDGTPVYEHHGSDAFWGSWWTLNVLWSLVYPEITLNFCHTLLDMYKNGGLIPRGPSGGNYTYVMIGASTTPLLVSAWQKGINTFDGSMAFEGMKKNHLPGGMMGHAGYEHKSAVGGGIEFYQERGYVPHGIQADGIHCDGAAQTLEYAFQDWCLGEMAAVLGKGDEYGLFMARADNYRNLWDPDTGFFRPRNEDGSWVEPFDPMAPDGWCEANGWHYLWWVPHDVHGLIELMGGRESFVHRLNEQFEKAQERCFLAPHAAHHEGLMDYGNQPSTHLAHLFNYAGAPWLTQKWVRAVMGLAKSDITPQGGYGGDEDQGQMGALNVLMAMGLFELRGGCEENPVYEVTSPIFDRVTITLDPRFYGTTAEPGPTLIIEAEGAKDPDNVFIQSAELNGRSLEGPWFRHEQLVGGATLGLLLGSEPNKEWGAREEDAPPSASDEK